MGRIKVTGAFSLRGVNGHYALPRGWLSASYVDDKELLTFLGIKNELAFALQGPTLDVSESETVGISSSNHPNRPSTSAPG